MFRFLLKHHGQYLKFIFQTKHVNILGLVSIMCCVIILFWDGMELAARSWITWRGGPSVWAGNRLHPAASCTTFQMTLQASSPQTCLLEVSFPRRCLHGILWLLNVCVSLFLFMLHAWRLMFFFLGGSKTLG